MTTLKLIKDTSITGEVTWKIIDQDSQQVGLTYGNEFEANYAFGNRCTNLEMFGNQKKSEVLKEFTLQEKTNKDAT